MAATSAATWKKRLATANRKVEKLTGKNKAVRESNKDLRKYASTSFKIISKMQREMRRGGSTKKLFAAIQQAIVDLSIHPAGMVDWHWYESLCLDVADRLEEAIDAVAKETA